MSRTDQEFKAEVLRRSEAYLQRRKQRRRKIVNIALCFVLAIGGFHLAGSLFAAGGSSESMSDSAKEAAVENGAMDSMMAVGDVDYGFAAYSSGSAPAAGEPAEAPQTLVPMVRIDGILYMDTGNYHDSAGRCGIYDGEITSRVAEGEVPTEDDQSNFGIGYGYQYGAEEGNVEIYLNGKWCIFTSETVQEAIQSQK